jgi:hypothetical protein
MGPRAAARKTTSVLNAHRVNNSRDAHTAGGGEFASRA